MRIMHLDYIMNFTRIRSFTSSTTPLALLCGLALTLTACSGAKETLGLERTVPDEFKVVKHAPLELPPRYHLRPPRPGAARPQDKTAEELARQAFTDGSETLSENAATVSNGESLLLEQANATRVDPDIRSKVDRETLENKGRDKPVVQQLLGIGGGKNEIAATVVDAKAEAQRLKDNAEAGKPLNEGESASIED